MDYTDYNFAVRVKTPAEYRLVESVLYDDTFEMPDLPCFVMPAPTGRHLEYSTDRKVIDTDVFTAKDPEAVLKKELQAPNDHLTILDNADADVKHHSVDIEAVSCLGPERYAVNIETTKLADLLRKAALAQMAMWDDLDTGRHPLLQHKDWDFWPFGGVLATVDYTRRQHAEDDSPQVYDNASIGRAVRNWLQ